MKREVQGKVSVWQRWFGKPTARWQAATTRYLTLETLEDRLTPSNTTLNTATPTTGFVQGLYQAVLNRTASNAEVQSWVNSGLNDSQIINSFLGSSEYESNYIRQEYLAVLGRPADTNGLNYYVDQMQNHGMTKEELFIALASSNEFYNRTAVSVGGSSTGTSTGTSTGSSSSSSANTNFVNNLYAVLLGRTPDSSGQAAYVNGLNSGESQQHIVSDMIASNEFLGDYAQQDYSQFLGRTGNASEVNYWSIQLRNGIASQGNNFFLHDADVAFLNSPEFAASHK